MRFRLIALAALTLAATPGASRAPGQGAIDAAAVRPLLTERIGSLSPRRVRTLVVLIPGDARIGGVGDPGAFATSAIAAIPASAAVIVTPPGHADRRGARSPGVIDSGYGDGFTPPAIAALARTLSDLRRRYRNARTVIVGESGGAVLAADLAGSRPALVDGMVLVACPCSLPEWLRYMKRQRPREPWDAPVASLDPLRIAGGLDPRVRVALLVSDADRVTPARFSRAYAEALALRGIATDLRVVDSTSRAILNDPEVLAATTRLTANLTAPQP